MEKTRALLVRQFDYELERIQDEETDNPIIDLNIEKMEEILIKKALQKHRGNISLAAEDLGLSRAALYRRMEKFEL